ncbi:lasso peptide biosynthesis B2 protein [Azospirillum thermophilum]|uniref:Lasso peptide biosynthesis B2 protein n=1 Tax=Azospirillum thermophilum TaxID=2202148 RepID=A0A2S2CV35_9PROT|nr:lasso peptide biosynthesis B2 protein [Azospirillum thermophilum]AWK88361.1 lasso peptide biosynthesis B2 protein [Azospirillum thermophilum]
MTAIPCRSNVTCWICWAAWPTANWFRLRNDEAPPPPARGGSRGGFDAREQPSGGSAVPHGGPAGRAGGKHGGALPSPTPDPLAAAVGRAVEAAARRLPWHPLCLEQALAAAILLRRRGIPCSLCIGVAVGGGRGFRAHAWLTAAGGTVCGGPAAVGMTPLAVIRPGKS